MRAFLFRGLFLLAIASTLPCLARAADGRIEINQYIPELGLGYPRNVDVAGSYVLTGPLVVPGDKDGIVISVPGVTIDLNGFSISSTFSCTSQMNGCIAGSNQGITTAIGLQRFTTVKNGQVRGFSGTCINLELAARVEDVLVSDCGVDGIDVGDESTVMNNQVLNVGQTAINAGGATSVYAHNTIDHHNLGGGSFPAIVNGNATAGNACRDGNCSWVDTRRWYYLTVNATYVGDTALAACDPGFHMASLWEILDVTQLHYDLNRGYNPAGDVSTGPPTDESGWIRTGYLATLNTVNGEANCDAWTTTGSSIPDQGTIAALFHQWDWAAGANPDSRAPWWNTDTVRCDEGQRVWCVQN